jgi:Tfp pilus assembly protein PilF
MSRCIKYQEMIERGEWERAVRELNDAYAADKGYTGAFFNLGLAFEKGGLNEIAAACYSHYLSNWGDGYWAKQARERLDVLNMKVDK